MKKTTVIILSIVGIIAAAAILYLVLSRGSSPTVEDDEIETSAVSLAPVSEIVGATGTVSSAQSALLTWKTSGLVADTYFDVGDAVQSGDVLAELDPDSLSPLDIMAQAELVAAQKALENLLESRTQAALASQAVESAQRALEDARNPLIDQASAIQAVAEAEKAVADAERKLKTLTSPVSQSALEQAQANLVLKEKKLADNQQLIDRIQKKLDKRDDQYLPWESRKRYRQIMDSLEVQRIQLQIDYENSLQRYENLKSLPDAIEVALAEAELKEAQAQLFDAKLAWQRIQDGPSPADLALLEAQLADAEREFDRLKHGPAPEDIAAAQARVTAAQSTLEKTRIVAPFNGTISEVFSKPNDLVSPGTPAFRLDDLSSLSVNVGVSEIDINLVEVGQHVILTFDAIQDKQYSGRVVEVSPVGTASLGIVDFMVKVDLTDADKLVRPGMTAAVEIFVGQAEEAMHAPNQEMRRGSFVLQLDSNEYIEFGSGSLKAGTDQIDQVLFGDPFTGFKDAPKLYDL